MFSFDEGAEPRRRVAIYIRVSTSEQRIDGYSLEAQKRKLIEHVNANSSMYTKEEWLYSDTHTGSDLNRDKLTILLKDVKAGKFDAVLVWKIDRLSRSLQHLLTIFEDFEKSGVSFISVQENIDFKGPIGKLIFQIFGAIAQFERELIKGRTKMGKIASAELGNYTGTDIPYGYKPVPNKSGKGKRLEIIPEERKWVREIYNWYIYEEDMGDGKIASRLNKLEVPRSKYRKEKGTGVWIVVASQGTWTHKIVNRILTSEIYRGEYLANKTDDQERLLPEDQWTIVEVPACVSEFVFKQAQTIREGKIGGTAGTDYLLSGKLKDYTLERPKSFVGAKRSKGGFSYRRKQFKRQGVHTAVFEIPGKQMDDWVWGKVLEAMKNPEVFVKQYLSKEYADPTRIEKITDDLRRYRESKINQELAIARIEKAHDDGAYSQEKMNEKTRVREQEIIHLDELIQECEDQLTLMTTVEVEIQKLREASEQVKFRLHRLSPREKRILCNLFVDRVEMRRRRVENQWRVRADIFYRFNPTKFKTEAGVVRTEGLLERDTNFSSVFKNGEDGGRGGI